MMLPIVPSLSFLSPFSLPLSLSSPLYETRRNPNLSNKGLGTSVASGTMSLKQAFLIGGCAEFLGAVLLGTNVTRTIQNVFPSIFLSFLSFLSFLLPPILVHALIMLVGQKI